MTNVLQIKRLADLTKIKLIPPPIIFTLMFLKYIPKEYNEQ